MKIITAVLLLILLPLAIIFLYSILTPKEPAKIEEEWWGGENRNVDKSIKPFRITWSNEEIEDLKYRLNNTREPIPPLEGAAWTYGTSATYLKDEVLSYWLNKYDFKARLEFLNHYPQFITNIQGLDIHFIHVKPSNTEGKRVLPLLILHGWPGSIAEFHKAIALLTKPRKNHDFVFEVVAPSLPGFGYSEAAKRPGLHSAHIALILKNLMVRLGHEKYYVHGGDWGAIISAQMSALRPENVMGLHSTMCTSSSPIVELKRLLYSLYPSLIVSDEDYHLLYPLSKQLMTFIRSTGYLHIQATKPDSLGVSLSDSPAGLASYILEKFSDATKRGNSLKEDGGLYENFTPDELIDNLMMYWIPNKITTSMRIYAESFNKQFNAFREQWPVKVPTACAQFPHEIIWLPEEFLKDRFRNLIQVTRMPRGGHFSMFEEPELATDDIWNFIEKAEALKLSHSHSTNKQDL